MLEDTMGLNVSYNLALVFPLKNSVAAVSPPLRIFLASSGGISLIAETKIDFACGAAFPAARFMLTTNSSTCFWYPALPSTSATFCTLSGMRILMAWLEKYPSVTETRLTALPVPTVRASFSPATTWVSSGPAFGATLPTPFMMSSKSRAWERTAISAKQKTVGKGARLIFSPPKDFGCGLVPLNTFSTGLASVYSSLSEKTFLPVSALGGCHPEMTIRGSRGHPSPRGAFQKTLLDEERFVHVLDRIPLLADRRRDSFPAYRSAAQLLDDA